MNIMTLLTQTEAAMEHLVGPEGPAYVTQARVRFRSKLLVVLELELEPLKPIKSAGYPVERVFLFVSPAIAFACPPFDDKRKWQHRLDPLSPGSKIIPFCLWYPDDPQHLRWTTDMPIETLIGLVFRHVQAEEYYRRNGVWPIPEAPHGARGPLPISGLLAVAAPQRKAG